MSLQTCTLLIVAATLATSSTDAGTARFNCGGDSLQVGSVIYEADRTYTAANGAGSVGGTAYTTTLVENGGVMEGTDYPNLYLSARVGASEYCFDVPNGLYLLRLHFAELELHGPGFRKFSVIAEGKALLQDFEIFAVAEKNYALTYQAAVAVTDRQLNVTLPASIGESSIAGIAVEPLVRDTAPPPTPSEVTAQGSYQRNIIRWPDVSAFDLAGYRVYRSDALPGPYVLLNPMPTSLSRYFDDDVVPGQVRYYCVAAMDVFGNQSSPSSPVAAKTRDRTQSYLPVYELTISPENLMMLQAEPFSDEYVTADFICNGILYPSIGVRYRGNISRTYNKKSWKLNFKKDKPFEGRDKLNQKAVAIDASLIRECLSTALLKNLATLSADCDFSHLQVNGEYRGVFARLENIDDEFLTARGLDPYGKLFEAEDGANANFVILDDYSTSWKDQSKVEEGFQTLAQFIETINLTPDEEFDATISSLLNVDSYLDYYATMMLIADFDHTSHNYYVYQNSDSLIWELIPKDYDASFLQTNLRINYGTAAVPDLHGVYNMLTERLLAVPRFRQWYVNKMAELLYSDFTPETLNPVVDDYHGKIASDAVRDVFKINRELNGPFVLSADSLKSFIVQRNASIMPQLQKYSPGIAQPVMINEVMAKNDNGITDEAGEREDWLEIYNAGTRAYNLTGHYITNDPLNRTQWSFPNETTIPAGGHLLVWLDGDTAQGPLHALFDLREKGQAVALYSTGDGTGKPHLIDVIAFGPQNADVSYGRRSSGSALWCVQGTATPNGPNAGR